jgi:predicted aspartyl protease
MRNRIIEFQKETGHYCNLEATPAEGTSFRLAKTGKVRFLAVQTANEKINGNEMMFHLILIPFLFPLILQMISLNCWMIKMNYKQNLLEEPLSMHC